jgi:secondary thiamine-phosphate synthase enzyme
LNRLQIRTRERESLQDITEQVRAAIRSTGLSHGVAHLWSMHTTCALTVNEGHDPDVVRDIVRFMRRMIPQEGLPGAGFRHAEGNSDSHLKTAFFGPGLTLLVSAGDLVLGTWQKVFLAEWDGPRERSIALLVVPVPEPGAVGG